MLSLRHFRPNPNPIVARVGGDGAGGSDFLAPKLKKDFFGGGGGGGGGAFFLNSASIFVDRRVFLRVLDVGDASGWVVRANIVLERGVAE